MPRMTQACRGRLGITLLMVAALSMPASAEVYTGMGAHGVRWFSDIPPDTGVDYKVVQLKSATPPPTPVVPDQESGGSKTSIQTEKDTLPPSPAPRAKRRADPPAVTPTSRSPRSRADRQNEARQKRCRQYETALRKLRAQRRAGYTAEQDRKQRQRRAELQEKQYAECPLRMDG